MVKPIRATFTGNILHIKQDDGSNITFNPATTNQWIAGGTGSSAPPATGGGDAGGITITAEMIEAAVTSVGANTADMIATSQEIADSFNNAIDATFPGILTDKNRAACLVGQCAHETDWFKTTTEYTAGGNPYSPYDGRGFIQLTWEDNYRGFGQWLESLGMLTNPEYFVNNPTRLADLKWASYTAVYYFTQVEWSGKNLFEFCTDSSTPWHDISRAINRGDPFATSPAYGEVNRQIATDAVLGVTPEPEPPGTGGDAAAVVAWMKDRLDAFGYSQDAQKRRDPITYGVTDCSALINYCYETVANIHVGWWTGSHSDGMQQYGTSVISKRSGTPNESLLQLGDLVFFNWNGDSNNYDHVDMYTGPDEVCGHGGPDNGPDLGSLSGRCGYAYNWHVRRYL